MNVNFNGYGESVVTFIADDSITEAGVPVKMSAEGTVAKCDESDAFCGVCVGVRDGYAAVQLSGYVTMDAGAKIGVGYKNLVAEADGSVSEDTTGREYLVVDSTENTVGFIL